MSPWPGWEDYAPAQTRQPRRGRATPRAKYGAEPHWVLPSLQLVPADAGVVAPRGAIRFASKREAQRFVVLKQELDRGLIRDLTLQKQFALHVVGANGVRVCIGRWIADFVYARDGREVVEDAKGVRTAVYQWKKQHVEAEYGIQIIEV